MLETKEETIEMAAHSAKQFIEEARTKVRDASWLAQQSKDYEVCKSMDSIERLLGNVVGLLISVPRLKG